MDFSIWIFVAFAGTCLATSDETPECEENAAYINVSFKHNNPVWHGFWTCVGLNRGMVVRSVLGHGFVIKQA